MFEQLAPCSRLFVLRLVAGTLAATASGCVDSDDPVDRHRTEAVASTSSAQLDCGAEPLLGELADESANDPQVTPAILAQLEDTIEDALETYHVPGVAVAIVEGNKLAYTRGKGLRHIDLSRMVNSRTVFRLTSLTKTMTSLMMGTLVDDGLLDWDDRVIDIWPGLDLPTASLEQNVRVRNMVGFTTGLAPHPNFQYYIDQHSATEMLGVMATLSVAAPLGTFVTQEEIFSASGYIAALAAGYPYGDGLLGSYKQLMRQRVFNVIGMPSATLSNSSLNDCCENRATGHVYNIATRSLEPVFSRSASGFAPGDGASSDVRDVAKYLVPMLNGGVAKNGNQVVTPARLNEIMTPQAAIPPDNPFYPILSLEFPYATNFQWALGWILVQNSHGVNYRSMIGLIDGYTVAINLMPSKNIGVVVLTNLDVISLGLSSMRLITVVQERLVELLNSLPPQIEASYAAQQALTDTDYDALSDAAVSTFSAGSVAAYVGSYQNGWSVSRLSNGTFWANQGGQSYQLIQLPGTPAGTYQLANGPILAALSSPGLPEVSFTASGGTVTMAVLNVDVVQKL